MGIRYVENDGSRVRGLLANPERGRPDARNRAWGSGEGARANGIRDRVRYYKGCSVASGAQGVGSALQHCSSGRIGTGGSHLACTSGVYRQAMGGSGGKAIQEMKVGAA